MSQEDRPARHRSCRCTPDRALATTLLAAWVGLGVFSLDFGDALNLDACFDTLVKLLRDSAPGRNPEEESRNG
jgi:hypothetical protein